MARSKGGRPEQAARDCVAAEVVDGEGFRHLVKRSSKPHTQNSRLHRGRGRADTTVLLTAHGDGFDG